MIKRIILNYLKNVIKGGLISSPVLFLLPLIIFFIKDNVSYWIEFMKFSKMLITGVFIFSIPITLAQEKNRKKDLLSEDER